MRNKILIGIVVLLISCVIIVRYFYKQNFEDFKNSVSLYESEQLKKFIEEKEKKYADLQFENPKIFQLFKAQFDEHKAMNQRDSTYSFLYLSGNVKFNSPSFQYFDCLQNKCIVDMQNDSTQQLIIIKEKELQRKFGEKFTLWYPKFKDDKLNKKINESENCKTFFPELFQISYNQSAWNDFEQFLIEYGLAIKESQAQNSKVEAQLKTKYSAASYQLNSGALDYFRNRLDTEMSTIITADSLPAIYSSTTLGSITYYVIRKNFNQAVYKNIEDDAFTEQWKYNSLSTGSMPYSYCYGSSNYCGNYCSEIQVRTGGSDVLATIKDSEGDVFRHAYIKSGHSFTFNVPDGQYQVFFYSGTGWNPNKYMTTSSCGTLHGGFVSAESFTKDDYISLNSQSMTYELIMQPNGNLNTQPSSMNEAFK
jgi:hypothetical protein